MLNYACESWKGGASLKQYMEFGIFGTLYYSQGWDRVIESVDSIDIYPYSKVYLYSGDFEERSYGN